MKKYLFALAWTVLGFFNLYAVENDSITYKLKSELDWSDFKMNPDYSDSSKIYWELTIVTYTKKVDIWFGIIKVESFAGFLRNSSWVKSEFKTDLMLDYVQLKYEIANLYAKRAETEINKKKINAGMTRKISKIIESYIEKMHSTLKLYDVETDFGVNQDMIEKWKNKLINGNIE
ncbi:MAG: hypothetical protein LBD59_07485 [Prevotellaceae bacterium]|jgi:hypothetical protein|nr:hypothetical protein [Prevotellaceae bacterium]